MDLQRREFLRACTAATAALLTGRCTASPQAAVNFATAKPNIVFILTDDLGYADLSCYGARNIKTPNLDRMAAEGLRLTDFHTPAGVCTPTRAALMTGCYPKRVGLHVAVLGNTDKRGLNPAEITLAELLRGQGYATGMVGKWHLGTRPEFLPTRQGFDYYYGMPGPNHGISDLYRGEERLAANQDVDLDEWTATCTAEAIQFIKKSKGQPFFLYLAHGAPHTPLRVSDRFRGKSARGLYGDVIEEIDWSVGEILKTLHEEDLDQNTLVIFTSDNGPSSQAAPPFHGGKGSTWEGGHLVPCIARWPGHVPVGQVRGGLLAMMDFYPTLARLAGAGVPQDRVIDGLDFSTLLLGAAGARSPRHTLVYCARDGRMAAIRDGQWKLHVDVPSERWAGKLPPAALLDRKPATPPPWLYDLEADPGETRNVAAENPEIVARLQKLLEEIDTRLEREMRPAAVASGASGEPKASGNGNTKRKK